MKKRMSRTNEARKTFKVFDKQITFWQNVPNKQETHQVDSLLDRRQKEDTDMSVTNLGGFMTMTFLGYYDKVEQSYQQIKDTTQILR